MQILGDGNQCKPYLHVHDLIDGIQFFKQISNQSRQIVNIGVQSQTTVNEIADIVIEEMALSNVNKTYTGGTKGWVGDVAEFQYDLSFIHQLGWKASLTSTDAVRRTIQEALPNL